MMEEFPRTLPLEVSDPSLATVGLRTTEVNLDSSFCLKSLVVSVYSKGLRAELTGRMNTITHAYKFSLMATPKKKKEKKRKTISNWI